MKRILMTAALSAALVFPAISAPRCMANKLWAPALKKLYGEVPIMTAMQSKGVPIVIFANIEKGTWTTLVIGPESSCMVASGADLELIARGNPT